MMTFLTPVLSKVLDAATLLLEGRGSQAAVAEVVPPALAFVQEGINLFEVTVPGILRNPTVEEMLRQIHLEQQAQFEALNFLKVGNLGKTGLPRYINSLRAASERLLQLFSELQAEEAKAEPLSPLPLVDNLIRVGMNLQQRLVEPLHLQSRLNVVAAFVGRLRQDIERFRLLYQAEGSESLAAQTQEPLAELDKSVELGQSYLNENRPAALQECLKLAASGSQRLHPVLIQFDILTQGAVRFHRVRCLEELARAGELKEPAWLIRATWANVEQALAAFSANLEFFRRVPLAWELDAPFKAAEEALQRCQEIVDPLPRDTVPAGIVSTLAVVWEPLEESLRTLEEEYRRAQAAYATAPNLGNLRELLGRTLQGELSSLQFMQRLQTVQAQHEEMLRSMEGASDPLLEELSHLARSHSMAYARMGLYGQDSDGEHLRQGWRLIAVTTPRMLELSQQLRERVGVKPAQAQVQGVKCFRCSAQSPKGTKFCLACNAMLPPSSADEVRYTDIVGGAPAGADSSEGTPANLLKLEELARGVEIGEIDRSQFRASMEEQLRNAEQVSLGFENKIVGMMGKNPAFDTFAEFFAVQMEQYLQGLEAIYSYADSGDSQQMRDGLTTCMESGRELQSLQVKLQEAARGGR